MALKRHIPWNKGLKGVQECSEKTRRKMNKARKGYQFSEKSKKKMSKSAIERIKKYSYTLPSHKGYKHTKKAKEKMLEMRKGKRTGIKNNLRKGGITVLNHQIRNYFEYKQWRSNIFIKDDFTCQKCNSRGNLYLEAHHIKSFYSIIKKYNIKTLQEAIDCFELWDVKNGITFYTECHKLEYKN